MPRFFTHYWANDTWRQYRASAADGELLDHAASNQFRDRGVAAGDYVYIVTVLHGALHLLTKLHVAAVCDAEQAADALATTADALWDAADHVVADESAPIDFDRQAPETVVQSLRFQTPVGPKSLRFYKPGAIDRQTMRGVRELTPESASILDQLLPSLKPLHLERRRAMLAALPEELTQAAQYFEGAAIQVTVNAYERNPRARAACIAHWGLDCVVCGFNFEAVYGDIGRGYIHVHHLRPLASIGAEYELNPVEDLRPVCANCHAMLHQRRPEPWTVEEVKTIINENRHPDANEPHGAR